MAVISFPHKLLLNRFFLSLFGGHPFDLDQDTFREVTRDLTSESLELRDADGTSPYLERLEDLIKETGKLTYEQLVQYDENISRHTAAINTRRKERVRWKYYQYLSLLFTEIYLDWYFRDAEGLLNELNQHLEAFNSALLEWGENKRDVISPYTLESLRKLAFWSATGSGKTLLMHVNLLQYQFYLEKYKRTHEINRIILLTPNEGLSHQHLDEFYQSNIVAAPFDKDSTAGSTGMFRGNIVDVIDMNKLKEEGKKKTVSVDQFLTNNLVFIDEAHRGSQGEVWYEMRSRMAKDGFTFEYSATLGQAVSSDSALVDEYAKSILFDYSYRYFHADGFGKDYQILNIAGDEKSQADKDRQYLYLTAGLLSFYQQLRLYDDSKAKYKAFSLEKPLWVFVGSKVTAIRTDSRKQVSDVLTVLLFLAEILAESNKHKTIANLKKLLSGDTGFLDNRNRDIFAASFPYLQQLGLTPEQLFSDILRKIFNADAGGALHVDYLVGGDGEIALRLGLSTEPFGVINVGDAKKLADLCRHESHNKWLVVNDKSYSDSLFRSLNSANSKLNILIGSKRFTEGWNSYRVSSLALMYVGQNEGSEIIQLFGRGIRLRGYDHSLKRSKAIQWATRDKEMAWARKDEFLSLLETLHVFGVQSDYMERFNQFLEGEGIRKADDREPITIPVKITLPKIPLITVKVPENINFKKEAKTTLSLAKEANIGSEEIVLDWYPRVASKVSDGVGQSKLISSLNAAKLSESHLAFMNFDSIYLQLQLLKAERGWHNFNLNRDTVKELLSSGKNGWYKLYAPKEVFEFDTFERVHQWQEIAVALLRKYCDRFYKIKKDAYEAPFREYRQLEPNDPNYIAEYKLLIDQSEKLIIQRLKELKNNIESGVLTDFNIGSTAESLVFDKHLYAPLLHIKKGVDVDLFSVSPVALNEGERDFVFDLRSYFQSKPTILDGKEIYLLRNQSRGRGVGFFEAGNFFPDFLLWVIDGGHQHVIFVDPKGILRCQGLNDPKLRFYQTVKAIEEKLADKQPEYRGKINLHSFVISNTPLDKISWWDSSVGDEEAFAERNILFQGNPDNKYIESLFMSVL